MRRNKELSFMLFEGAPRWRAFFMIEDKCVTKKWTHTRNETPIQPFAG
jgi:hypothetical protein